MGILKVFTVYDSKAEAYLQPFFMHSKGQAVRMFQDLANDPQHQFFKYAADFTMFEIGTYDESSGLLSPVQPYQSLGCAIEFVRKPDAPGAQVRMFDSSTK